MSDNLPARQPLPPQRPQLSSNRKLTELTVDEMSRVSVAFEKSAVFKNGRDAMRAAELFVIILAGQELGLGPSQAIMGIKMIEGKPEMSANTIAALVKASGRYDYRVEFGTDDDQFCQITFFNTNDGSDVGVSRFSKADAIAAGIYRNNYSKYWRNMMFARAVSNGAKWYCPDALRVSAYHEGETGGDTEAPPPAPETPVVSQPQLTGAPDGREAYLRQTAGPTVDLASEERIEEADVVVEDDPSMGAAPQGYPPNEFEPTQDVPFDYEPVTPVSPPPTVTSSDQVRTASPAQLKLLRVRIKAANLTNERWHEILKEVAGVDHTDRTPFAMVNPLLERLQQEAEITE